MPSVVFENRSIRMFKVSYRSAPKKQHLCSTSWWTPSKLNWLNYVQWFSRRWRKCNSYVFKAILTFAVDHFEFPIGIKTIITCKGLWNFKTMFTTIICRSSSIWARSHIRLGSYAHLSESGELRVLRHILLLLIFLRIGMKSNNTCAGHFSEHLCQVWLKSVQCFSSRPWKCCFSYGFKANFDLRWQWFWISDGLKI
jgi:hypothetical protein